MRIPRPFDPNSDENYERIRKIARDFVESPAGHEIIRDVIRYTLGEPQVRALILSGFSYQFAEERINNELSQRVAETKEMLTSELEGFRKRLELQIAEANERFSSDRESLKNGLERSVNLMRHELVADARTACVEAQAVFEATLRTGRATAIEKAQRDAESVIGSMQAAAAKNQDDVLAGFASEVERRRDSEARSFTEWMDREFARKERELRSKLDRQVEREAGPLINVAVHDLFVAILGENATMRIEDARAAGIEQGRSEGYRQGHEVGRIEGAEEGRRTGYQTGHPDGYSAGYMAGHNEGHMAGHNDGYAAGHRDGYNEGYTAGAEDGAAPDRS
jgi:hypothetical protein